MKINNLLGMFILTAILLSLHNQVFAQDDEYQKWLEQQQKEYTKHITEEDKAFSDFLLKSWKTFQVKEEKAVEATPKPIKPPVAQPVEQKKNPAENQEQKPVVVIPNENVTEKAEQKKNENQNKVITKNETSIPVQKIPANSSKLDLDFYDLNIPFIIPNELSALRLKGSVTKESIGDFWKKMSASDYENLLKEFLSNRDGHILNGWGYCKLLNLTAWKIYPDFRNERQLFIWFMLNKSGYQARVGISDNKIYLLLPFKNAIFDVPFFKINGSNDRMYVVDFDNLKNVSLQDIITYDGDYSQSNTILELSIKKPIKISNEFLTKTLQFTYRDTTYKFEVKYNNSLLKFFYNYPYTNLSVYFNSSVSEEIKQSLINGLKPILKGRSMPEAVNVLLRFVQTAFGYKLDEEQFKCEKPLFVEETVFYKYCDCEDRSILFSFLIRELLGLEVVGLDYPGHVASAVRFDENLQGDFVKFNGAKYMITDPTYIDADLGMSIPDYKNMAPLEIITTNNL